jgi:hypothetical protein
MTGVLSKIITSSESVGTERQEERKYLVGGVDIFLVRGNGNLNTVFLLSNFNHT